MKEYSIIEDKNAILSPNSLFERRVILQYYLDNNIVLNIEEKEILQTCVALEPESIGIIGCLLADDSFLNTLRLAIGSKNKSNHKLAEKSTVLLNKLDLEAADLHYMMKEDYTLIEEEVNRVYSMIYFREK